MTKSSLSEIRPGSLSAQLQIELIDTEALLELLDCLLPVVVVIELPD